MIFRHDDPVEIPNKTFYFADDKVASVFMGWKYAVTTNGGENWRVAEMRFPPADNRCLYNCIEDLRIETDGTGEAKLNLAISTDKLTVLETVDYGKTWREE